MGIYINAPTYTREQAKQFCADHVIVKKVDLDKLKQLCIDKGIYEDAHALDVFTHEITLSETRDDDLDIEDEDESDGAPAES